MTLNRADYGALKGPETRIGGSQRAVHRAAEQSFAARLAAWVMVRVTGLLLAFLVLGHFTLTHIVVDVAETDSSYVASRLGSAFFLAWDWLMLGSAVLHGASGVWVAIGEYTHHARPRWLLRLLLVGASAIMLGLGTFTLLRSAGG